MAKAKERITDPQIRVVIAGQLKQGKSQLLNSLLNVPVSRVGDDETTVVATMVSYGEQATAKLIVAGVDGDEPDAIEIPIADIKNDLRRHPAAGGRQVLRVAVTAKSPLLKGGLVFVDTPGVGGHGQPHLSATLGLLPDADAMLMISDTSQEFTEPEMTFIRQAFEICPVATIVATKTDLYPHWREIVEVNKAHLQRAGLSTPMIPASSLLRSHAIQLNDKELNEESNFPAIVKFLSEKVLSRENDRVRDQVLAEIRSAAEHLTLAVESELSAINDPDARDRLKAELERRKEEAQDALQQTALWQQVLNDGIADLTADVDHDLRGRFRAITQHTEHVIDTTDPTHHWAEIGAELENAIATAVGDNFVWAYQRAEVLAQEVARTFVEAGLEAIEMPQIDAREMGARLRRIEVARQAGGQADQGRAQGRHRHARLVRRRADVRHADLVRRAGHVQPAVAGRRSSVGPQDLQGRHGEPDDAGAQRGEDEHADVSSTMFRSWSTRNRATGSRGFSVSCATTTAASPIRPPARSTSHCRRPIASAQLEENERVNRVRELERQLNILKQVTDHAVNLAPGATEAAREPVGTRKPPP